jgi:hypothetical protein
MRPLPLDGGQFGPAQVRQGRLVCGSVGVVAWLLQPQVGEPYMHPTRTCRWVEASSCRRVYVEGQVGSLRCWPNLLCPCCGSLWQLGTGLV